MGSVYQKPGRTTWYMHVKDGAGRSHDLATKGRTKTEAKRLALEYGLRAERQRFGLEPLPSDATQSLSELCSWWLRERCKPASLRRESSRLGHHVLNAEL